MSTKTNSSLPSPTHAFPSENGVTTAIIDAFATGIRGGAFWTAVVLPFVTLLALTSSTIDASFPVIAALVGANALCALAGHGYATDQ